MLRMRLVLIVLSTLFVSCVGYAPTLKEAGFESPYRQTSYATYRMNEDNRVVIHRTDIMDDDYVYDEDSLIVCLKNIKSQRDFYFTEQSYQRQLKIVLDAYEFAYPYWHPNLKQA